VAHRLADLARLPAVSLAILVIAACGAPPRDRTEWQEPQESSLFTTGPYILLGPGDTAFIAVKAKLSQPPNIDWWRLESPPLPGQPVPIPHNPVMTTVTADRDGDLWVATLTGLPIGPYIGYRVRSRIGTTPAYRFRIGIPAGEPFRFAAFGDTRTGHFVHRQVIEAMAGESIDFVLHTGDMVEEGNVQAQWDLFFQIERPLLVNTPIVPSIGNHDMGSQDYYGKYFLLDRWSEGRRYFAHDWGNLRVIAIDGGIECREGCVQYTDVAQLLDEGRKNDMLMAMMLHYPPYSSGQHGSNDIVQEPVTNLSRQYGVELVIAGHDHNYERTKPIYGTTYLVSGSAGAPIRPVNPKWFTAEARTEPHYILVDVDGMRMTTRAINIRGDTFDSYVIEPNPPAPDR